MNSVSSVLGSVMKTARTEKHLTQRQLAERLSITRQYLMSIENKKKLPGRELLFQIIRELNLPVDTIFHPEHGEKCELVYRLHNLLGRLEEHDIEHIIAILQVLLEVKCAEGGDLQCCIKCPQM